MRDHGSAVPGYVPPIPDPSALIDWPEAFGRRFAIFVDVEEEFDWSAPLSRTSRSVTNVAAIPAFHARLAARGVPLTYLVDYPVADDPRAREAIAPLLVEGSTVGAQLHPWVTPPDDERLGVRNSFAGNLPVELEAAKLDVLTAAIEHGFGVPPRAYRAGRYGIGPNTIRLLAARGYRIDTSIRARFDYRGEGGPDFRALGNAAYRVGGTMIEIPLTAIYTGSARAAGPWLHPLASRIPHGAGALARAGVLSRVPLTPEGTDVGEAVAAIAVAARSGMRLLSLSFHSPSLIPGHTPYVRDAADLARFDRWWDGVLDALAAHGYRAAGVDDLLAAARLPMSAAPR